MSEASYFSNHALGRRWPWSLYHRPIDRAIRDFLAPLPAGARVLNVGCGMFLNLPELPQHLSYTGVDVDPRAAAEVHRRFGIETAVTAPEHLPFPDHTFDATFASEVIEHCAYPERWLADVLRVTRPGGRVLITTPNYGSMSLKVIESTALEVVARLQGFTRRNIHPFPCTAPSLEALARAVGAVEPRARVLSHGWVIVAEMRAPC
jgi:SAM-dependent methyltransferase